MLQRCMWEWLTWQDLHRFQGRIADVLWRPLCSCKAFLQAHTGSIVSSCLGVPRKDIALRGRAMEGLALNSCSWQKGPLVEKYT